MVHLFRGTLLRHMTPLLTLAPFLSEAGVREVTFSVYRYVPRDLSDQRRLVTVPVERLAERYEELSRTLGDGEEIAFHSSVNGAAGETLHIPMIDFHGASIDEHVPELEALLSEWGIPRMALFSSGRSFHGYGLALFDAKEWVRFMGRLLLLNPPPEDRSPWVDARWIGHRLMSGSGALRWSWSSSDYHAEPALVATLNGRGPLHPDLPRQENQPGR